MSTVFLIGGHGKVALLAAPLLVAAGHRVTSVVRNPDHVADVEATGATALVLDIQDATTEQLVAAIGGHDAVVWSAGAGGGDADRTYAVDRDAAIRSMDAAEQAGARRYVMVSYLGARPNHGVPEDDSFFAYAEAKAAADAHLRASDLHWTILGPGMLTTDEPSGSIEVVDNEAQPDDASTARGNVARAIVAALAEPTSIDRQVPFVDGDMSIEDALKRA